MFGNDSDRRRFLILIMSGVCDILRAKEGLSSLECYQNFCRLLGRLKANYQLSELVRTEGYEEWLKLAAEFAVHSFSQMHVRGGRALLCSRREPLRVCAILHPSHFSTLSPVLLLLSLAFMISIHAQAAYISIKIHFK